MNRKRKVCEKMEQSIISEGKTTAEAIEKGLKKLNISKEEADIKVLEEKKKNFFSILDPHIVRVEIKIKENISSGEARHTETGEKAKKVKISSELIKEEEKEIEKFLKELLNKISEKIEFSIIEEEDSLYIKIKGEGSSKLIGYRGEALNALQLILSSFIKNKMDDPLRVIVDIEGYRDRREKTLEELANKLEKTVIKNGKSVKLEPMSPYERKIIHTALQNSEKVKTYSVGEGENRRVIVSKK